VCKEAKNICKGGMGVCGVHVYEVECPSSDAVTARGKQLGSCGICRCLVRADLCCNRASQHCQQACKAPSS
jgi:hypothetical protein